MIWNFRKIGYKGLIAVGGRAVNCNPGLVQQVGADLTAPNGLHLQRILGGRMDGARMPRRAAAQPPSGAEP